MATTTVSTIDITGKLEMAVKPGQTEKLTCEDGDSGPVFGNAVEYTDFPLEEITFYFINNTILPLAALTFRP